MSAEITIRPLASRADYEACVELQRTIWGPHDCVPASVLMVAQKVGGIAAGAFDARGKLLGCVFGLTGPRGGRIVHWSHFLAVRPDARDLGIGRRLKHYQRRTLRARGVTTMYWTFDPLVARNAHLNLNRLGVAVEAFVPDMYGRAGESTVDPVLGTDRFVVRWDLGTKRTRRHDRRGGGRRTAAAPVVNAEWRGSGEPQPAEPDLPDAPVVQVVVPADIQALKEQVPTLARAWRSATRRALQHYLGRGYRVSGFLPSGSYFLTTSSPSHPPRRSPD